MNQPLRSGAQPAALSLLPLDHAHPPHTLTHARTHTQSDNTAATPVTAAIIVTCRGQFFVFFT